MNHEIWSLLRTLAVVCLLFLLAYLVGNFLDWRKYRRKMEQRKSAILKILRDRSGVDTWMSTGEIFRRLKNEDPSFLNIQELGDLLMLMALHNLVVNERGRGWRLAKQTTSPSQPITRSHRR